jgi:prepilin-type N-terminal cleavage/methylation domain-containing protein
MMRCDRRGFTLIEILIVVVIIGILASVAIPKFAATKDRAKLASLKSDLRNMMTAQETYFSDYKTYGSLANLRAATRFTLSPGNTLAISRNATGYRGTARNNSITNGFQRCRVQVGMGVTSSVDGVTVCF